MTFGYKLNQKLSDHWSFVSKQTTPANDIDDRAEVVTSAPINHSSAPASLPLELSSDDVAHECTVQGGGGSNSSDEYVSLSTIERSESTEHFH